MYSSPPIADDEFLRHIMRKRDVGTLCKALFKHDLSPTQQAIARLVAFPEPMRRGVGPRVIVNCHTRFGKSFGLADGLSLRILVDHRPLVMRAIGPFEEQAAILRNYLADNIVDQPLLAGQLDLMGDALSRVKKEVSKRRFTFKDGKEFTIHTAEGKGGRNMGFGADILALDESCLISEEPMTKVMRMLADSPSSELYELSNPWHKEGHYHRHWQDQNYRRIHVPWQVGVAEGRVTEAFVEEQRRELPTPHFQVLWDSVFPDQAEDQLIPSSWAERAIQRGTVPPQGAPVWGLDVAEGGADKTALTRVVRQVDSASNKMVFTMTSQRTWNVADTMTTATLVRDLIGNDPVHVDENGVGKGVADRLRELGCQGSGFKGGRAAQHKERFSNLVSEVLWNLRTLLEEGRLKLIDPHPDLIRDLSAWRWELKTGRISVHVQGGKSQGHSPDRGDSLAMALWHPGSDEMPVLMQRGSILM